MSYRRADDHHFIGRLHDRLCAEFGDDRVFRDIDSIPPGTNFRDVILNTLNEVDVVVAVIGPNWGGRGAGSAQADFVYLELAEALRQGKPVIPALMEGTSMPPSVALPAELRPLTDINAIWVHGDPTFRRDCTRLVEAIRDVVVADRVRLSEQLREEERAARVRLAELEDAAAKREIELERARLQAISRQLRQAEPPAAGSPSESPEPQPAAQMVRPPRGGLSKVQLLVIAALACGIVALFVNRSQATPFNEFSLGWTVDLCKLILTLAVGVPLLFEHRPVEQRSLLVGVTLSVVFFSVLLESSVVTNGATGYDEQIWFFVRLVQVACLVGATIAVERRPSTPLPRALQVKPAFVAVAIVCGVLSMWASYDAWVATKALVDNGYPPGRTPFAVWFVFLLLGPMCVTIALATRSSYSARLVLATIATFAATAHFTQALIVASPIFDLDPTPPLLVSLGYALLAAMALWTTIAANREVHPQAAVAPH
jgi:hypothetical protein